jgi:hypothetical protein
VTLPTIRLAFLDVLVEILVLLLRLAASERLQDTSLADSVAGHCLNQGLIFGGASGAQDETELLPEWEEYRYHV